jgi:uncharacterized membrane protein YwaF
MDTVKTIPKGLGFSHFDGTHIGWLLLCAVVTLGNALWYRKLSEQGRRNWRIVMACLLFANEVFKHTMLLIGDRWTVNYIPLHLCSINIFTIGYHAFRPNKTLNAFLYTVVIPATLAALLFPTWTELPVLNFSHLHSFTIHICLLMYPIVLTAAGEIRPDPRNIPQCLGMLALMAVPALGANLLLGTNFMFLMEAEKGNPLYLFQQMWGNHLYGFPVLITAVLLVMYIPVILVRKHRYIKRNLTAKEPSAA